MTERRGRVLTYGLFQLRDYLVDRGLPTLLIGALGGFLTASPMLPARRHNLEILPPSLVAKWGGIEAARAVISREYTELFLRGFLGSLIFLGALFAMNGIISNDRKQGYFRFLFTKPIRTTRYYGQAFVIHFLAFLGIVALLGLIYTAFMGEILSWQLMAGVAGVFLCYAGIAFVLSGASRFDWLSLVAVTVLANFVWGLYGDSRNPLAWLLYLLPPVHRTQEVYQAIASRTSMPWSLLAWYAAYGLVTFTAGLIVLRKRRLAIV